MSTLQARITDLATRMATECKSLRTLINANSSDLSALTTTDKTSLIAAINTLQTAIGSIQSGQVTINDASSGGTITWSATKIASEIQAAKNALTNGAAAALDTLAELAAALGNDANFASTTTTALSNRLRFDAAQTLTAGQKTQACTNLGIGEPDTDFVSSFTSGLEYRDWETDRKSTRLNSSHRSLSRMPSSA